MNSYFPNQYPPNNNSNIYPVLSNPNNNPQLSFPPNSNSYNPLINNLNPNYPSNSLDIRTNTNYIPQQTINFPNMNNDNIQNYSHLPYMHNKYTNSPNNQIPLNHLNNSLNSNIGNTYFPHNQSQINHIKSNAFASNNNQLINAIYPTPINNMNYNKIISSFKPYPLSTIESEDLKDYYSNKNWDVNNYYNNKVTVSANSAIIENIPEETNPEELQELIHKYFGELDFIEKIEQSVYIAYSKNDSTIEKMLLQKQFSLNNSIIYFLPNSRLKTLYITHLDKRKSPHEIESLVSDIVVNSKEIRILPDSEKDNKNKGYCFVEFSEHYYAKKNFESILKKPFLSDNRSISIQWAEDLDKHYEFKSNELHIKGIDSSITMDKIIDVFNNYGNVVNFRYGKEDAQKKSNYGFITYNTSEEASNAIKNFNWKNYFNKQLHIEYAKKQDNKFTKKTYNEGLNNTINSKPYGNPNIKSNRNKNSTLYNSALDSSLYSELGNINDLFPLINNNKKVSASTSNPKTISLNTHKDLDESIDFNINSLPIDSKNDNLILKEDDQLNYSNKKNKSNVSVNNKTSNSINTYNTSHNNSKLSLSNESEANKISESLQKLKQNAKEVILSGNKRQALVDSSLKNNKKNDNEEVHSNMKLKLIQLFSILPTSIYKSSSFKSNITDLVKDINQQSNNDNKDFNLSFNVSKEILEDLILNNK